MTKNLNKPYRPCVVGVFINDKSELLVGLRSDADVWQFPQGGIESGETKEQALRREIFEEVGLTEFKIINMLNKEISYDFPKDLASKITKHFKGQRQTWFLCKLPKEQDPTRIPFDELRLPHDEFRAFSWMDTQKALDQTVWWKKDSCEKGLKELGLLKGP